MFNNHFGLLPVLHYADAVSMNFDILNVDNSQAETGFKSSYILSVKHLFGKGINTLRVRTETFEMKLLHKMRKTNACQRFVQYVRALLSQHKLSENKCKAEKSHFQ